MLSAIVTLLIFCIVIGVAWYLFTLMPLDPRIKNIAGIIILAIVVIGLLLWLRDGGLTSLRLRP